MVVAPIDFPYESRGVELHFGDSSSPQLTGSKNRSDQRCWLWQHEPVATQQAIGPGRGDPGRIIAFITPQDSPEPAPLPKHAL